jgi:hypothetical protein
MLDNDNKQSRGSHAVKKFLFLMLLSSAAGATPQTFSAKDDNPKHPQGITGERRHTHTAPELDLATTLAAVTLLGGGMLVLRGRRRS